MSEDWKNERAEASMREGTESIRKAAEEKAKQEEQIKTMVGNWEITVHATGPKRTEIMNELIADLVKLEKEYTGDDVTISIDPIIKPKDV
jgi:acetyl-CoA carboxylase alpha subunit